MAGINLSLISDEPASRSSRLARFATTEHRPSHPALPRRRRKALSALTLVQFAAVLIISLSSPARPQTKDSFVGERLAPNVPNACGNLTEKVPAHYRERYDGWKAAFLSVESGRRLWLSYACDPAFRLTIAVSKDEDRGAEVVSDDYRWDGGKLVAATIVLGYQLDQDYPSQFYYPVLGSLAFTPGLGKNLLAAAKIAHEFGHIDHTANSDGTSYQSQNALGRVYASHFDSNGHNADDPILTDLAKRMGGTPLDICIQREYWAETYALRYLLEKLPPRKRLRLLGKVRESLASAPSLYYVPSEAEWEDLTSSFRPASRR
jgi:hypothetical protein